MSVSLKLVCITMHLVNHSVCMNGHYRWLLVRTIKGHVKLIQRVKIAHSFLQSASNLSLSHFKLAYVVLHMPVKEFFETHF